MIYMDIIKRIFEINLNLTLKLEFPVHHYINLISDKYMENI